MAKLKTATFGAGCFWGVEEAFRTLKGVKQTTVGFMGGDLDNPTYEDVCTDKTGHAEVVQLLYDPGVISFQQLLEVFWKIHDPTTLNRQGLNIGTQYRSVIFYHSKEQQDLALKSRKKLELSGVLKHPIVTQIVSAGDFWKAEEYHQKYFIKKGIKAARC